MSARSIIIVSTIFLFSIALNVMPSNAETVNATDNIYKRLSAIQCDSLIKANETNPNFVILDVRRPDEYSSYHLMGSINRSTGLTDFDAQLAALPKHKLYLLHCQSGGRSAGAFTKMKNLGFAEVYEMIGGIGAWDSAKLPTTTVTGPKLMLVSKSNVISGNNTDTIKIAITNRANEKLTFNLILVTDSHLVTHNFNSNIEIDGAQDYTFSIVHSPGYSGDDSTKISIESNGGKLDINIVIKNGVIQRVNATEMEEISVYPNPASGKLYFKNIHSAISEEISIINITGKVALKETNVWDNNGIDVSALPNGIYIVRIKTDQQIVSKKFVLKR
jgi:phage shock protein E